jgi:hypothetical protein
LAGTGIRQNLAESGGIQSKYRNSCPAGNPAKKSCERGQKQEFLPSPPKPRSCEKFLRKTQEKKEILRNPGRNGFFGPKNKFLKTGITNLDVVQNATKKKEEEEKICRIHNHLSIFQCKLARKLVLSNELGNRTT